MTTSIDFSNTGLEGATQEAVGAYIDQLKAAAGDNLRSVALYGSAARPGQHNPVRSDVNLMVIVTTLDVAAMQKLAPIVAMGKGKAIRPFVITERNLTFGGQAFPAKFMSIKEGHVTLLGDDLLGALEFDRRRLILRLDADAKELVFRLRRHYLLSGGVELTNTMIRQFSPLLATLRIALSVMGESGLSKTEVLDKSAQTFDLDRATLDDVASLRDRELALPRPEAEALYDRFITLCQTLAENIGRVGE